MALYVISLRDKFLGWEFLRGIPQGNSSGRRPTAIRPAGKNFVSSCWGMGGGSEDGGLGLPPLADNMWDSGEVSFVGSTVGRFPPALAQPVKAERRRGTSQPEWQSPLREQQRQH